MTLRVIIFVCFVAYAHAGHLPVAYAAPAATLAYAAPVAKAVVAQAEDYDPNPQYSYGYDIQDRLTGDSKSQSETRNGDVVEGSYSVVDPDGTRRTVEYTADPVNGFNAVVHKEPIATPVVAKVATPVAYAAAPAISKLAAPVAYATSAIAAHPAQIAYPAAPAVARISYSSPTVSYHI